MCEELQEDHKKMGVKRHVQFGVDEYGVVDIRKNLPCRNRNHGSCVDCRHFGGRAWGCTRSFYENSVLNSLQKEKQIL